MVKNIQQFITAADGRVAEPQSNGAVSVESMPFYMTTLSQFGSVLPPYWSRARDRAMVESWKDITLLGIMMFAAQTKIANLPFRVVPKDPNIHAHSLMAQELTDQFYSLSQYGEGLQEMMVSVAEDYFGTDNGAFIEVVAEGNKSDPISGIPIGMRHLDSLHVTRVSDPLFPIRYMDGSSKEVVFHHSRVMSLSQMRSARREKNGIGYCAISRSIELAQRYQDVINYIRGKMGGKAFKRLLVGKNITGRELIKAIAASTAFQQEIGGTDVDSIAVGGVDISVEAIDLANFSEFSEEDATFNTMALMALAWGLEFNEAFPMVGSKASEEVALQRSRGRLPSYFVSRFSRIATAKLVPTYLTVEIDFIDDYLDQQREVIADIRSRNLERLVTTGVFSARQAREVLYHDRYISESTYLDLSLAEGRLPDGTPVSRVFFDREYDGILTVDPQYLFGDAPADEVRHAVTENLMRIYELVPSTSSQANQTRFKIAICALNGLLEIYDGRDATPAVEPAVQPPAPETEPNPDVPIGKMRVTKATVSQGEFTNRFRGDVLNTLNRPGGPSDEELSDRMEKAFLVAALLALGRDTIGSDEAAVISREMSFLSSGMAAIIARAVKGTDMNPTADRLVNQIWRVYWDVLTQSTVMDGNYTWTLGATENHCSDCAGYAAKGSQPASFWQKVAAENGHYPASAALECAGYYCDCSLR